MHETHGEIMFFSDKLHTIKHRTAAIFRRDFMAGRDCLIVDPDRVYWRVQRRPLSLSDVRALMGGWPGRIMNFGCRLDGKSPMGIIAGYNMPEEVPVNTRAMKLLRKHDLVDAREEQLVIRGRMIIMRNYALYERDRHMDLCENGAPVSVALLSGIEERMRQNAALYMARVDSLTEKQWQLEDSNVSLDKLMTALDMVISRMSFDMQVAVRLVDILNQDEAFNAAYTNLLRLSGSYAKGMLGGLEILPLDELAAAQFMSDEEATLPDRKKS